MGSTGQEPSSICAAMPLGRMRGQIFSDAAAGDVRHAGGHSGGDEFLDHVEIAAVRLHQRRAGFLLDGGDVLAWFVFGHVEHQFAGERVAVGVQAGGGESDKNIACLDVGPGDHLVAIDGADDEAGKVIFAVGIKAGHLGCFAADEGAAVGLAGIGEAGDYGFGDFGVELAAGEVVEEEERGGALDGDVVDAVVHQVGTDTVSGGPFRRRF